jgi:4-hydroxybenzoate polyprenyltransferase
VLAAYEAGSILYTLFFKRFVILDIVVLASFYTVRLVGGALVGGAPISPWLGALSQFMFFSLATGKRYSELSNEAGGMGPSNQSRGYRLGDMPMLLTAGVCSGLLGVLVLALYVSSENSIRLYARPDFLWALCPLLMLWVCRFWLITNRGEMNEDPVWFALKDRASHCIMAAAAAVLLLAGAK